MPGESRTKYMKMENNNCLPIYQGPSDVLREGFYSNEHHFILASNIEKLQKNSKQSEWISKLMSVKKAYGSSLAMRLAAEKSIMSSNQRLPGLPSSTIALDTVIGDDLHLSFENYLNGIFLFLIWIYSIVIGFIL